MPFLRPFISWPVVPDHPTSADVLDHSDAPGPRTDLLIASRGRPWTITHLQHALQAPTPLLKTALDCPEAEGHLSWNESGVTLHWPQPTPA